MKGKIVSKIGMALALLWILGCNLFILIRSKRIVTMEEAKVITFVAISLVVVTSPVIISTWADKFTSFIIAKAEKIKNG